MVKIIWANRALNDLEDIAEYIAKNSGKYAKVTIEGILQETKLLEKHPLIGRIVPEVNNKKIREIIKGSFRIIYEYDKPKVNILTIHHTARDLRKRGIFPDDK